MNVLPIDEVLPSLRAALQERDECVLQAPPGAGKTTRVPLALLDEPWLAGQRILMLEPRRLAARAAAERLASELGEPVGQRVGYRIRLERKVSAATRIEVVTEGILTRLLQQDPALEGVGLVIFDEFHERSLEADLALALCLSSRELLRERPLKLLLMSATVQGEALAQWLNQAPQVVSQGRSYPVTVHWGAPWQLGERIEPRLQACVQQAIAEHSGSILVFLPGQAEIRRVAQALNEHYGERSDLAICPLYGELELAAQRAAIEPAPTGVRKIVLATNLAETSLTIEGVQVVIDSGLERVACFDPASGMTRLHTQRIAKSSATQRAGRAGRLQAGHCYRLWSEAQHDSLPEQASAQIVNADLSYLAVQVARWGMAVDELQWLDAPPKAAYQQACAVLRALGALDEQDGLTTHGRLMSELPAHPRLAHLLLRGHALGLAEEAALLAAFLSERDFLREQGCDLQLRLEMLHGVIQAPRAAQGALARIRQLAKQLQKMLPNQAASAPCPLLPAQRSGCLLALAYPERIAKQRQPGSSDYRLASGRAARFLEVDALCKEPWLVVAELGSRSGQKEERIFLAAVLDPALFENALSDQVRSSTRIEWDERDHQLRAERLRSVGSLVLESEPLTQIDAQQRAQALLHLVRRKGLNLLPWTEPLRQWQARVALLRRLDLTEYGQSDWPDVSDAALLDSLDHWLLPYLDRVSRLAHFAELDLAALLSAQLPWPLPKRLDEQAPQRLEVPSGSAVAIDYSVDPPVLAVRLQELFGLERTPHIANGRQPLLLHLLSPARRPVQVTGDLASFWDNTYAEVKKDLKGRYPKHYWPDDPRQAQATARIKPRN